MPQRHTPFEQVALLLQGGGALGAYQAGVYEALAEADLHPDWVAESRLALSIRRSSPAIRRSSRRCVARILAHGLYFTTRHTLFSAYQVRRHPAPAGQSNARHEHPPIGAPNFFVPRMPPPMWPPCSPGELLRQHAVAGNSRAVGRFRSYQFRRDALYVGAVEVAAAISLISTRPRIRSLSSISPPRARCPPGFPATKIGEEYFWDGGLISNTPLEWVLDARPGAIRLPSR